MNIAQNANSIVTRHYDDAGHLDWETQNVTGLGSTKTVNYPSYDNDGRLTDMNVTGASYDCAYRYDAAGRFWQIFVTGANNSSFEYAYDAASNETHRYSYLPNSKTIDQVYAWDSLNMMSSRLVKKNTATFSTEAYTYDHMKRVIEVNGGGSADFFSFYWDGELMSGTYGGGPHFPFAEGQDPDLDAVDNIDANAGYKTPDTEDPEPAPPPDDPGDPPVGGLIPLDLPTGHSVGYYFDKAGNRQQVTDTANPTINFVINNLNQYNSASGCSITNGLEHEISSFQGLYDTQPVTYNYLNDEHLISVISGGGSRYFYYDALGRCVKRSPTVANGGNTTYYIYDGEKPILEYSSTGIVGRNVYGKGVDEILMRTNPGVNDGYAYYYAQDHEGSVTHLLDGRSTPATQTGNVIEQYHYDAFGLPTFYDANTNQITSTACNNRFLFTGREYAATYRNNIYVPEFRFYEYRARAYHPDLGRFMSEDPKLFDAGDYNLFRYCHNDPIDFTDAMGLEYNDPYEGSPGRFEMVGTITHPGVDRYGETQLRVRPMVVASGHDLILKGYNVDVGKRIIATETKFWGKRSDRAIEATKEHEDKHVSVAKALHDQYRRMIGDVVGQVGAKENAQKAAERAHDRIADEFETKTTSHEPKSAWRDIMRREDDGNTGHNFSFNQQQRQQQTQQQSRFENPNTLYFIQIIHGF